jgi:SAM-dependent MidA family methyltransferase
MPDVPNQLTDILANEIGLDGSVSFARFMELALYHPVHGYYRRSVQQIGCQGDFYTSVSVGSLFGELLAFRFGGWLEELLPSNDSAASALANPLPSTERTARRKTPVQLIEAGAHDGRLAFDILSWFTRQRPELLEQITYWILEPGSALRAAQEQRLERFAAVRWFTSWEQWPLRSIRGVVFSNELLDAFPVYRLGWDATERRWFEWRVTWANGRFHLVHSEMRSPELAGSTEEFWNELPPELLGVLPDQFTIEVSPIAGRWWSQAAACLARGKLLTLDYGLEMDEVFVPHRQQGTLRSYRAHQLTADPLANPGEQDLTAHVNFSALQRAGEQAGLKVFYFGSQAGFLTRILEQALKNETFFSRWTPRQRRQFQTLTHPEHLGRSFRVLAQETQPGAR